MAAPSRSWTCWCLDMRSLLASFQCEVCSYTSPNGRIEGIGGSAKLFFFFFSMRGWWKKKEEIEWAYPAVLDQARRVTVLLGADLALERLDAIALLATRQLGEMRLCRGVRVSGVRRLGLFKVVVVDVSVCIVRDARAAAAASGSRKGAGRHRLREQRGGAELIRSRETARLVDPRRALQLAGTRAEARRAVRECARPVRRSAECAGRVGGRIGRFGDGYRNRRGLCTSS